MASPSTDIKTQNPAAAEPTNEAGQTAAAEATKPISPPSVFVNSEPIRPEQVENAVKFLSHPKVRGSPVMYRRSFLEKKGLTKEEIDEAFRLFPDPSPAVQAATVNQDTLAKTVSNTQTQAGGQAQQPAAAPTGVLSKVVSRPRFHWTHAVYAIGILAVSGAGTAVLFKKSLVPRLKSWIRKIVTENDKDVAAKAEEAAAAKPSVAEEAAAAAKAAADAAAQVAKASREMMNMNVEEKTNFRDMMDMLEVQLQELRTMSFSIRKLEAQANNSGAVPTYEQDHRYSSSKQPYSNGKHSLSGRSSSPPAPAKPSGPPHPKSYMEIMSMVQRGERPPNVKDINDSPPNPYQQISNPSLAPRSKPWDAGQAPNSTSPYQLPTVSDQGNVNDPSPWWQQKNARITEVENEEETKVPPPYYSTQPPEQTARRSWVPPQPPPIAMAEAAEAIRRPKQVVQKEQQPSDDQTAAQSSDDLQRITKISETGGEALNTNGMASDTISNEIQEEIEQNY